jgi:hypothetical protein
MRTILFYLCFLLLLIISCNKAPEEIKETPTTPAAPVKQFTKVYLFGASWAWGGGICSWGWIMVREDSSNIVYHATHLPASVTITTNPVWVNIQYHDTANFMSGCWDDIVVDSLKF